MFWLKRCRRCGGDLYMDRDGYGTYIACLQCGDCKDLNAEVGTKKDLAGVLAIYPEMPLAG